MQLQDNISHIDTILVERFQKHRFKIKMTKERKANGNISSST